MIAIPFFALLVGALLAYIMRVPQATGFYGQCLAVACLAGLDTILGGIRGGLEDKFDTPIFVSGFLTNIAIAFLLTFIGVQIYLDLYLVVAFVFGNRIFSNLSLIRRSVVIKIKDEVARRKRQAVLAPSTEPGA